MALFGKKSTLDVALKQVTDLLDERAKILEMISTTTASLPGIEQRLDRALVSVGDAEARAALDGSEVPSDIRQAIPDLESGLRGAQARIAGLERRFVDLDEKFLSVEAEFGEAHGVWLSERTGELNAAYQEAVQQFAIAARRAVIGLESIGCSARHLRELDLPKLDGSPRAVEIVPTVYSEAHGAHIDLPLSAELSKLQESLGAPRQRAGELARIVIKIRERQHAAVQADLDRKRDARPQFSTAPTREYPPPTPPAPQPVYGVQLGSRPDEFYAGQEANQ